MLATTTIETNFFTTQPAVRGSEGRWRARRSPRHWRCVRAACARSVGGWRGSVGASSDDDAAKGELMTTRPSPGGAGTSCRALRLHLYAAHGVGVDHEDVASRLPHPHGDGFFTDGGWDPPRRTLEAVFDPDPRARCRTRRAGTARNRPGLHRPGAALGHGRPRSRSASSGCSTRHQGAVGLVRQALRGAEDQARLPPPRGRPPHAHLHKRAADLAPHPESERGRRIRQELVSPDTGHKLKDLDKLEAEFAEMDDYARSPRTRRRTLRRLREHRRRQERLQGRPRLPHQDLALDAPCDWPPSLPNMTVVVHPDPPSSYVANRPRRRDAPKAGRPSGTTSTPAARRRGGAGALPAGTRAAAHPSGLLLPAGSVASPRPCPRRGAGGFRVRGGGGRARPGAAAGARRRPGRGGGRGRGARR